MKVEREDAAEEEGNDQDDEDDEDEDDDDGDDEDEDEKEGEAVEGCFAGELSACKCNSGSNFASPSVKLTSAILPTATPITPPSLPCPPSSLTSPSGRLRGSVAIVVVVVVVVVVAWPLLTTLSGPGLVVEVLVLVLVLVVAVSCVVVASLRHCANKDSDSRSDCAFNTVTFCRYSSIARSALPSSSTASATLLAS
jgi:hypothetical protein